MPPSWSAVVLSGGTGQRLGGADKAALEVGGATLLERALAAVTGAEEVVVVGPDVRTARPVRFTREQPAGSGPAAALLHGVGSLSLGAPVVVALAVDMPLVTAGTVARLLQALGAEGADGRTGPTGPCCTTDDTASRCARRTARRACSVPIRVRRTAPGSRCAR